MGSGVWSRLKFGDFPLAGSNRLFHFDQIQKESHLELEHRIGVAPSTQRNCKMIFEHHEVFDNWNGAPRESGELLSAVVLEGDKARRKPLVGVSHNSGILRPSALS